MATDPQNPSDSKTPDFPNFLDVLKELMAAYQPILQRDLTLLKSPENLDKEARNKQFSCEDEIALANEIFGKFWNEQVARQVLPKQAIEILGPRERWSWCLLHIRCCFIFGWLVCHGPRTLRRSTYYLNRYWRCVRETVGNPVSSPYTAEERKDFQVLVEAFAAAYKPFATEELAVTEDTGISAAVLDGKIDCYEDDEKADAVFQRFLNMDIAPALLGTKAFDQHRGDSFLSFCRCWCLCAIRFGCCLARAKTIFDVWRCLVFFFQCLVDCFHPLTCAITKPADGSCAEEAQFPAIPLIGIEIIGTAAGAGCDHYILEWKGPADPPLAYTQAGIVYAGSPGPGMCGIVNGTLGWLDTFGTPVPDQIEIRLSVFPVQGAPSQCTSTFALFRKRVWISAVEGVQVESPPGALDNSARLIEPVTKNELSFGTALEIFGHALVGKCFGKDIKRYTLSYQPGFVNDPTLGAWTQFWQVDYNSPKQRAAIQTANFDLTSFWTLQQICLLPSPPCPPLGLLKYDELIPGRWISGVTPPAVPPGQFFPIDPELPPIWASQSLPPVNCYSGKYTLRLGVEDTAGGIYYDLQHIWFDNKAIYGEISGLLGVKPCAIVNLSQLPNAGDCTKVWPLGVEGIAYDEYIFEGDFTIPSDNYGGYCVTLTKQGGAQSGCSPITLSVALPVPAPASPTTIGTNRIGDPGLRCVTASPPPAGPVVKSSNVLTQMDGRMFDFDCASSATPVPPLGFALKRADPKNNLPGECCAFYFVLEVWDKSICPSNSGGRHEASWVWPIYICNDLPPKP
jgi:hypothetical protein